MEKAITILKGKAIREVAKRLTAGKFRIEKENLNRYAVFEGTETPDQVPSMYLNRVCFIRLDSEIYKIQSRSNPLAFAIDRALDNDDLTVCISRSEIDNLPVKLLARTFSSAKVILDGVSLNATGNCFLLRLSLVKSVSERDLTEREKDIAEMFRNAIAAAGNPEAEKTAETLLLPPAETVNTTAKTVETVPAK